MANLLIKRFQFAILCTIGTVTAAGAFTFSDAQAASAVEIGVGIHTINNPDASIQTKQLLAARRLGFHSIRSDANWSLVEKSKGKLEIPKEWDKFVDGANGQGIDPILILDYGNRFYDGGDRPHSAEGLKAFSRYAAFVVEHFKGRVKQYEIWNEWDGTTGGFSKPGSPDDYANLINSTLPAVRGADSNAKFLLGSGVNLPNWYLDIAKRGLLNGMDGLSIHPYAYAGDDSPEQSAQKIVSLQASLRNITHRSSIDFYITEIGWPTHIGRNGYSDSAVAAFIPRTMMLLSALPYVKGVWWYDLKDDGQNPLDKESRFGLLNYELGEKPASIAVQNVITYLQKNKLVYSPLMSLSTGKVQLAVVGRDDIVAWSVHSTKADFSIQCESRSGNRVDPGSSAKAQVGNQPTVAALSAGKCLATPIK